LCRGRAGLQDGSDGFEDWTIESVVRAIKKFTRKRWIDLFYERYLNIDKLEKARV